LTLFSLSLLGGIIVKSMKIIKRITLALAVVLMLALPCFAYAENSIGETDGTLSAEQALADDISVVEATPSDDTAASTALPEQEPPLSIRPYETGWSLTNLLASLLTIAIGIGLVISSTMRRNNDDGSSSNFGLTVFGMTAAVMATILFTSTEDIQTQMIVADSFTVVHLVILAVAVLCVALSMKKTEEVSSIHL
jgi:hypothetical protein